MGFDDGIERTVEWYRDNEWWWKPIRSGDYLAYYERQYGSELRPGASSASRPGASG